MIPRKPIGLIQLPMHMHHGLVGYWAFNEKDGSLIYDHSKTMANGVFTGVTQRWMPQYFGPSLYFDGDADLVDLGTIPVNHPLQLSGEDYTIMIWCKAVGTGDAYQRILDKSDGAFAQNGYAIALDESGDGYDAYVGSSRRFEISGSRTGDWQQVTFRSSPFLAEMIIDRVRVGTVSPRAMPNVETNMRFGSWNHSTGREFRGNLGLVILYDRWLSDSELKFLYDYPFGFERKRSPIWAFPEFVPSQGNIYLGTTELNNAYLGSTQLQKIMLGSTQLLP